MKYILKLSVVDEAGETKEFLKGVPEPYGWLTRGDQIDVRFLSFAVEKKTLHEDLQSVVIDAVLKDPRQAARFEDEMLTKDNFIRVDEC